MKISLIVPCYNEQEALPIFYRETKKVMESMDCDYEMIFVNDGSKDGTLELLKEFAKEDTHVTYIGFSRNFGRKRLCMPVLQCDRGLCGSHGCGYAGSSVIITTNA